jgi:tetratricopeptide (TPR) repeat protein
VTTGTVHTPHVDPEALGVYLEGHGTPDERAAVETHLAACGECYELFVECARELRTTSPEQVSQPADAAGPALAPLPKRAVTPGRWWMSAAAAVLVGGVAWLAYMQRAGGSPRASAEFSELVATLRSDRMVAGRLSGGVPYGPPPDAVRGGSEGAVELRVQAAAARVQTALSTDARPEARGVVAVSYLVSGQVADAVGYLERAAAADADNALIQNDLAVAYLERAGSTAASLDLVRGLKAAERAVSLAPAMPEAVFNQALLLQRLGRDSEAAARWRAYLALDPASDWAAEARRHLERLNP